VEVILGGPLLVLGSPKTQNMEERLARNFQPLLVLSPTFKRKQLCNKNQK